MLKFLVRQQKIEILEREIIASDQIAFVTLKFTFDGDWKNFHKVVQFVCFHHTCLEMSRSRSVNFNLDISKQVCILNF